MIPFRVFDRKKKITWLVLNYHSGKEGGEYLVAREDDTHKKDGDLQLMAAEEIAQFRMVGFVDKSE